VNLAPSQLSPVFQPRIWGTRSLAPFFNSPSSAEPIGEVWLTGDACEFASGPLAGQSLGRAWPQLPVDWTGRRLQGRPRIPLLVKFLFPADKLSVQVHPGDEYAHEQEGASGGLGKTEMWYAVAAYREAELRLGFTATTTPETFRRAVSDGTTEECLRRFPVHANDAFFIPAGTPHSIGPGMILCEIQQHSDITYRIFDYNRVQSDGMPRTLHLQQAFDVMQFGVQPPGKIEPLRTQSGPLRQTILAACRHFTVEHWEFAAAIAAETSPEQFELLIFLEGRGTITLSSQSPGYKPAEAWLLPAALGAYRLVPEVPTQLLRAYLPDLDEFARGLAARGVELSAISGVMHT
jgi:mannose-6-phosphate isomerase